MDETWDLGGIFNHIVPRLIKKKINEAVKFTHRDPQLRKETPFCEKETVQPLVPENELQMEKGLVPSLFWK